MRNNKRRIETVGELYKNGTLYKDHLQRLGRPEEAGRRATAGGSAPDAWEEVAPCEGCARLGHIPNRSLIFYTINPDPEKKHPERYDSMTPLDQAVLCGRALQYMVRKYGTKYNISHYTIHTEFTKTFNIHLHGIIAIAPEFGNYTLTLVNLQKVIHNLLGRRGKRIDISCNMQWVKDPQVYSYLNKENVFRPIHYPKDPLIGFEMRHTVPLEHPDGIIKTSDKALDI